MFVFKITGVNIMPKSNSPIRLERDLMNAATLSGNLFKRSTAEQIEYWAGLGRSVSGIMDPASLLSITAGLSKLRIEEITTRAINPDDVFENLERDRDNGDLVSKVTSSTVSYQASITHPGLLEQISPNGVTMLGSFENGQFVSFEGDNT